MLGGPSVSVPSARTDDVSSCPSSSTTQTQRADASRRLHMTFFPPDSRGDENQPHKPLGRLHAPSKSVAPGPSRCAPGSASAEPTSFVVVSTCSACAVWPVAFDSARHPPHQAACSRLRSKLDRKRDSSTRVVGGGSLPFNSSGQRSPATRTHCNRKDWTARARESQITLRLALADPVWRRLWRPGFILADLAAPSLRRETRRGKRRVPRIRHTSGRAASSASTPEPWCPSRARCPCLSRCRRSPDAPADRHHPGSARRPE